MLHADAASTRRQLQRGTNHQLDALGIDPFNPNASVKAAPQPTLDIMPPASAARDDGDPVIDKEENVAASDMNLVDSDRHPGCQRFRLVGLRTAFG